MNEDYARGYLAAIIDGEGYVVAPNDRKQREVVVEMCDLEPIERMKEACDVLGVRYRERGRPPREGRRRTYAISIASQQGLTALAAQVTLAHPVKRERLAALLLTYVKKPYNLT
jgi:intein-encoded DNA endonuclease-like protein